RHVKILITGASGFIGRSLLDRLGTHEVIGAIRPGESLDRPGIRTVEVPEIDSYAGWEDALSGVEAVIHLAGRAHALGAAPEEDAREHDRVNRQGTARVVSACRAAGVRRFVFVSTVAVFGEGQEHDYRGPGFGVDSPFSPQSPYGTSKLAAEKIVRESGMEWVILRPAMVVGNRPPGNLQRLGLAIARGMPVPLGLAHNRRSLTPQPLLVEALARSAEQADAHGCIHPASTRTVSSREMAQALGEGLGRRARCLPVPPGLTTRMLRLIGREGLAAKLFESFVVDPESAARVLRLDLSIDPIESLREAGRSMKPGG
ncbi:MAG: NAD-dependent epimerase/dehydratase family protein, partial [Fimbriimonadaceae bacterium]|nr:NAD-dependent epimerase/dehydratase family protein [Fimbriimonadaceae bacterium]